MGPVRQNPIQRTVRTAHLSVLMTVHNFQCTIQHRTVLIISTSDNHHSSDVVYQRRRGGSQTLTTSVADNKNKTIRTAQHHYNDNEEC